ncbi:S-adenosylmethionine-dependent methyltransferase [Taxawa tesnikishii (nom. ined.)]|nr:S-adenosylmethionine-dependent methyltransferase [Dothideales sp. JES 119]
MLPTPSTSHVSYDQIYEPAEDSYLFLDTLSSPTETAFLHERFATDATRDVPLVLEVGTGSGVVLAFLAAHAQTIFGRSDILNLGVDINSFACKASAKTVLRAITENGNSPMKAQFLDSINADLTTSLRPGTIDVLVFNPPYVPAPLPDFSKHAMFNSVTPGITSSQAFERDSHLLELSYAGGEAGMEITNRLLEQLPEILNPVRGVAYILFCAQNKPEDIKARIRHWPGGWTAETVGSSGKKAGWEKLSIVRVCKT